MAEAFDAWLRESPQHLRAYLEMSAVWEDVGSLDPSLNASADELIARARAEESIVRLRSAPPLRTQGPSEASGRKRRTLALAKVGLYYALAASILLTLAGSWFYTQRNTYSTGVGEQRSIVLNDGSTVELNSRTRVRVRFSAAERDVDLIEGQALFRVAKNPIRPFIVSADGTHVRAVGTQFDVYRKASGTVVTVVEGKVAVFGEPHLPSPSDNPEKGGAGIPSSSQSQNASTPPNGAIFLAAGEQVTVTHATAAPSPKRANLAAAMAWTQRSLVFDSAPLTEVAEEFNRYNARQLTIDDPGENSGDGSGGDSGLEDFHVSGAFSSA